MIALEVGGRGPAASRGKSGRRSVGYLFSQLGNWSYRPSKTNTPRSARRTRGIDQPPPLQEQSVRTEPTQVGAYDLRVAQNIYDDAGFFEGYSGLPQSMKGLDGAPEWPSPRALLPDMTARSVVDLGCGFGWFCSWAATAGAADVLGIDLSSNMLARAAADTTDGRISFCHQDVKRPTKPVGVSTCSTPWPSWRR